MSEIAVAFILGGAIAIVISLLVVFIFGDWY